MEKFYKSYVYNVETGEVTYEEFTDEEWVEVKQAIIDHIEHE